MSKVEFEETLKCSECAAPIRPNQERCDYCGYWLKQPEPIKEIPESIPETEELEYYFHSPVSTGVSIIVAFILAMVGIVIGINLIQPVSYAVGSAIGPSASSAISTLAGQITWIFVLLFMVAMILFLGLLGKKIAEGGA